MISWCRDFDSLLALIILVKTAQNVSKFLFIHILTQNLSWIKVLLAVRRDSYVVRANYACFITVELEVCP